MASINWKKRMGMEPEFSVGSDVFIFMPDGSRRLGKIVGYEKDFDGEPYRYKVDYIEYIDEYEVICSDWLGAGRIEPI